MQRAILEIAAKHWEVSLVVGDITKIPADAIGNAANSGLVGGGGVDGAIHRAGGPAIMRELDQIRESIGSCPPGDAVATRAGNLNARWVIHAVGPVYKDGQCGEAELLQSCYRNAALALSDELDRRSHVDTAGHSRVRGSYGYPMAAWLHRLRRRSTVAGLGIERQRLGLTRVQRVTFVLFDKACFSRILP